MQAVAKIRRQVAEVKHPDESMLLAYVRRQSYPDWPGGMRQHIDSCTQCKTRCNEYAQVGTLLEALSHSSQYQSYPPIADRVLWRIEQSQRVAMNRQQHIAVQRLRSLRVVSLPTAFILALLCTGILIALAYQTGALSHISGIVSFNKVTSISNETPPQLTPKPTLPTKQSTKTPPSPVATSTPDVEPTPTSGSSRRTNGPKIQQCAPQFGPGSGPEQQNGFTLVRGSALVLSICGSQFTPYKSIALLARYTGFPVLLRYLTRSDAQGKFHVTISIPNCNFVPASLIAVNIVNPKEMSQVLTGIQVGNCPIPTLPPTDQPYPGLPPNRGSSNVTPTATP